MRKFSIFLISLLIFALPAYSQDYPDELLLQLLQGKSEDTAKQTITIYLNTEIGEPKNYVDLTNLLDNAKKEQTIIFKINSPGGDVLAMLDIINAIKRTKATTIADIQFAASAAALIALSCNKIKVERYAIMMLHSMRGGMQGTPNENMEEAKLFVALNNDVLKTVCKGFLTDKEIDSIITGSTMWIYEDSIVKRIKK